MSRYRNQPRSASINQVLTKNADEIVINMFLELGLPFILRFVNDWRAGKTTVKEAVEKVKNVKNGISTEKESSVPTSAEEAESLFLEKVERELGLPEYNLFSMSPTHPRSPCLHVW
jgi:anoctamin-10